MTINDIKWFTKQHDSNSMNIPKTDNYWQDLLFLYTETNKAHNPPVFDLGKKLWYTLF